MSVFLTGPTAYDFWFRDNCIRRIDTPRLENCHQAYQATATASAREIPWNELASLNIEPKRSRPIHVAVPEARKLIQSARVTSHVRRPETSGGFIRLTPNVYIESPAATAIRSSSDVAQATLNLNRCLACFQLHNGAIEPARPLTTRHELESTLEQIAGAHGTNASRTALQYALENAASPRECAVAALLVLPMRLGGQELPKPQLNAPVTVYQNEKELQRYIDFYWESHRVALEYDGIKYHALPTKMGQDSARRTMLMSMGITVITLTSYQLENGELFREAMIVIRRMLGARSPSQTPYFTERESALRERIIHL